MFLIKRKSKVKNIFIQKLTFLCHWKEQRVAQKKKSVKINNFKAFMKTQVFVSGVKSSTGRDVKQILVDDSLLFLSLSLPLDWELNGSL